MKTTSRRQFLAGLTMAGASAFLTWPLRADTPGDREKPNILLIMSDDMGYADVGFHGAEHIPSPALDRLAEEGVVCTDGYVSAPLCSPSRAGLMTGRHQCRFGHDDNNMSSGTEEKGLSLDETTVAERLKAKDYTTGIVGKWHLGATPRFHPMQRGFDEFYGFLGGLHDNFKPDRPEQILRGKRPVDDVNYLTDDFARESCDFIRRHQNKPWFLYLSFNAVHSPVQGTPDRLAKITDKLTGKRRRYAAYLLAMDEAVGQIRKTLAETGQDKNTLIMFLNDNGGCGMLGHGHNGAENAPLRGHKWNLLEGGIRVPFVVVWPGRIKPSVYKQPVISYDLTATALAVAGAPSDDKVEGVNLIPYLEGKETSPPHKELCWRFMGQMAIRDGDYKLVRYDVRDDIPDEEHKKYTREQAKKMGGLSDLRLYNLADDIGETKDVSASHPEVAMRLKARWEQWNAGNAPSP
jgi:arylsulfatase A-like enzyme